MRTRVPYMKRGTVEVKLPTHHRKPSLTRQDIWIYISLNMLQKVPLQSSFVHYFWHLNHWRFLPDSAQSLSSSCTHFALVIGEEALWSLSLAGCCTKFCFQDTSLKICARIYKGIVFSLKTSWKCSFLKTNVFVKRYTRIRDIAGFLLSFSLF